MNLKDMLYITTVAEERSITKAAAKLYVSQPALSQCVQKVEKELSILIFNRGNEGVFPTVEGKCFLEFAKATLNEKKSLEKRLNDLKDEDYGEVRVGFTGTQGAYVLPHFLPQFNKKYPAVNVVLVEASANVIESMLESGEIQVGITHPPVISRELESFELSYDEMVIVPRAHSRFQQYIYYREDNNDPYLNIEFLRDEPIITTHTSQRSRMTIEQIFQRAGITPIIKLETHSLNTIDAFALVDYGTVLLPSKQVSPDLRRRGFYKIDPLYSVPYTFDVATRKGTYCSRVERRLIDFLRQIRGTF